MELIFKLNLSMKLIAAIAAFLYFNTIVAQSSLDNLHSCLAKQWAMPPIETDLTDYNIIHYDFDLKIERNARDIGGVVTITAVPTIDNFDAFEFQLHDNFKIDSIVTAGRNTVVLSPAPNTKVAYFSKAFDKNQLFALKIYYNGKAPLSSNNWGNGIVQKKDTKYNAEVIYSLSVPYHALEWFPCKQVLSDIVDSVTMRITTASDNVVISNGVLKSDTPTANDKHQVIWQTNYPINYYLISFALGKYIPYHYEVTLPEKNDGKLKVMNYLYNQASLTKQQPVLDKLGDFLGNYSTLFGLYPFHKEKFGTVVVPLSGGMEHQTIVNLATDYDKYLAAHEMAHQWWGDNVNIKSYHDVWLNEGWASYCEYLTAEKLFPSEAKGILDGYHNNALGQSEGRTYIADTTNFTTIYNYANVYMKGAAIIHTLRYEIGNDSLFFATLKDYQTEFAHKSVDATIFKAFLESKTGKDLSLYFNQWYYGYGYPKFTVTWTNKNNQLIIKALEAGSSSKTPFFNTRVEYLIKRSNLPDTIITLHQFKPEQTYVINNITDVKSISIDPRNVILNKVNSIKEDPNLVHSRNVQLAEDMVKIFPNPAKEILNISNQISGTWYFQLIDEKGTLVFANEYQSNHQSIQLPQVSAGLYIVKIIDQYGKFWADGLMIK